MTDVQTKTETLTPELTDSVSNKPIATRVLPSDGRATPDAMILFAMQQGADLERLERLYALKRQWEADEARKAFVAAMAAFKAEPLVIEKNKKVGYTTKEGDFVGYDHADLAAVVEIVAPAMSKHGLSHRWNIEQRDARVFVTCILQHAQGHSEQITLDAAPDNSGKKNAIQQVGSAITYMERYSLMAICGVAARGQDDDGGGTRGKEDEENATVIEWIDGFSRCETIEQYQATYKLALDEFKGASNFPKVLDGAMRKKATQLWIGIVEKSDSIEKYQQSHGRVLAFYEQAQLVPKDLKDAMRKKYAVLQRQPE